MFTFLHRFKNMLDFLRSRKYTGDVVIKVHFINGNPSHVYEWGQVEWNSSLK